MNKLSFIYRIIAWLLHYTRLIKSHKWKLYQKCQKVKHLWWRHQIHGLISISCFTSLWWQCSVHRYHCNYMDCGYYSIMNVTVWIKLFYLKISTDREINEWSFIKQPLVLWYVSSHSQSIWQLTQIAKFMGPTWDQPGSCRPQVGPMLAPWTLLSG